MLLIKTIKNIVIIVLTNIIFRFVSHIEIKVIHLRYSNKYLKIKL